MSYDSTNDTVAHIQNVRKLLNGLISVLQTRAEIHDVSKLSVEEKPIFDEFPPKLRGSTYGSDEYFGLLKEMQVALNHHYRENAHHPEHFENGIRGMTLVDLLEMICDWYAASMRHADGDIMRSIDLNQTRFGYSDDLKEIFKNTAGITKHQL